MAQSVKHPTLGFVQGHDFMVHGFGTLRWALCWQCGACLGFSLFPTLSAPSLLSLSLKINKEIYERLLNVFQIFYFKNLYHHLKKSRYISKHFLMFIYLEREKKRTCTWVGEGQGEMEKENPKQSPCSVWSPKWGLIPWPWDYDLSQNQESDAQQTEPPRHPSKLF